MGNRLLAWEAAEDVGVEMELGEMEVKQCALARELAYLLVIVYVYQ